VVTSSVISFPSGAGGGRSLRDRPPLVHAGSAGVDGDRHRHGVGDHVVDRRAGPGLLDELGQLLGGGVALDREAHGDALVAVADLVVETEDGRHRSLALGNGLLHELSTPVNQAYGIGEGQRAGADQRRVFAQAVTGDAARQLTALIAPVLACGDPVELGPMPSAEKQEQIRRLQRQIFRLEQQIARSREAVDRLIQLIQMTDPTLHVTRDASLRLPEARIELTVTNEALADGYQVRLEYSDDLLNWNTATTGTEGTRLVESSTQTNGDQVMEYFIEASDSGRAFWRIAVF